MYLYGSFLCNEADRQIIKVRLCGSEAKRKEMFLGDDLEGVIHIEGNIKKHQKLISRICVHFIFNHPPKGPFTLMHDKAKVPIPFSRSSLPNVNSTTEIIRPVSAADTAFVFLVYRVHAFSIK